MSYDLLILSARAVPLPGALPDPSTWRGAEALWIREGPGWQLAVASSVPVLPEDIPDVSGSRLRGIAYQTEITLSPVSAPETARHLAVQTAQQLAAVVRGFVHDPQIDAAAPRAPVRRRAPAAAALLTMSWWFAGAPLVDGDAAPFVAALETRLAAALPRRYGNAEPPQYVYAETGLDHLLRFIHESGRRDELIVWYPHPPVAAVSLRIPPSVGGSRLGFRSGRLTIQVEEAAVQRPDGMATIQSAWRAVSQAVRPFYGDVRTLRGFIRRRGRYWHDARTEAHPVCSWWWAGIPAGPVYAAVLGDPYRERWPSFCARSESEGTLCFASVREWRATADALAEIGPPPRSIVQPAPEHRGRNDRRAYPPDWPFGPPRRHPQRSAES